ncbi:cell-cell signaling protein CsgA [Thalassolituus oleivorans]|uniref:SDR family NAD(P)-dependent oxidoreductase n=1 Tax=Thalassolituus oleivorans TaxID=187493 RepID=UPI0009492C0E|nr:SDR family NAD(P)-dependent oxidoreductase [Thalassolituus oleivorans]APR66946.1 cell-cell signaling protein CsgA [Thalassolituus oleivorans]
MRILVAGSSGGIGKALVSLLREHGHTVFTVSRAGEVGAAHCIADLTSPESVAQVSQFLNRVLPPKVSLDAVYCCAGILHTGWNMPEKTLVQMSADWLQQSMAVNVLSHVHLAQAIAPLVTRSQPLRWLSLSAMVGSATDNGLGGWYSYRMSKAALNMFVKNLSIEWGRKSPQSVVVAVHPGTTDTLLSQPFQAGIAEGKLYTPEQSAERMVAVMEGLKPAQNGHLLYWDGSVLPF